MGKQSARLYFREKDHKDIYFQGKYHNALYVCKDDATPELYWRKLYDEGYFVYTFKTFYWSSYSRYTAIMYPKYKIREYHSFESYEIYHSDKLLLRTPTFPPFKQCWISEDGKIWKKIDLSVIGSNIWIIIPKWNGIIICNRLNGNSDTLDYIYYPIKNGYIDEENSTMIYSDSEYGTKTGQSVLKYANIADALILCDTTKLYDNSAFAVDINRNIHNNLFNVSYYGDYHANGCLNEMYWALDCPRSPDADGHYPIYAYTSANPYSNTWERHTAFLGNSRWNYGAIQAKDYIVLYLAYNIVTAVRVYKTTNFTDLEQIEIPDNLLVPIVEPKVSENIKYVNIRLKPSAETREDSINYNFTEQYFTGDIFRWNLDFVENQKISPFKGMLLQTSQALNGLGSTDVTIYIDNLFFEKSENNFAICESVYPEQYMNDYMEEKTNEGRP